MEILFPPRYEVDDVYYDSSTEPEYQIWDTRLHRYHTGSEGHIWHHWIKEIADAHCHNLNEGIIS